MLELVSSNWWFYVVVAMLIYFGISAYSRQLDLNNMGMFNVYLQIATLTIFLTNLLLTLDNYRLQSNDRHKSYFMKYSNLAQIKINDIDKMFMNNPMLNRLYFQMYRGDPHIEKIIKMTNNLKMKENAPNTQDAPEALVLKAEHHASSIIFQTMADIYMAGLTDRNGKFYCEDLIEWYQTFKKWMRSPILRSHWLSFRDEHHPKFRIFIEQLSH